MENKTIMWKNLCDYCGKRNFFDQITINAIGKTGESRRKKEKFLQKNGQNLLIFTSTNAIINQIVGQCPCAHFQAVRKTPETPCDSKRKVS